MRCTDIDVALVATAATTLKQELDRVLGSLGQCKQELVAAEERLNRKCEELRSEREALQQERYIGIPSLSFFFLKKKYFALSTVF